MTLDLTNLLNGFPYEPGQINARLIRGDDGEPRIQIRVDLGILQMHVSGRPDGLRPHGFPSLLEYYEAQADEASPENTSSNSTGGPREPEEESEEAEEFSLSPDDCRQLREEAAQFYHRYVALMALEDFEGVIRDTTRNLRLLDFIRAHAESEPDREVLEQFRPYIVMMRARAMASQALKDNEPKAALLAIDHALEGLKTHFEAAGEPQLYEQSSEVEMLRGMREALVPKLPISQKSELKRRLARALEQENYELAAILRDELKMLKDAEERPGATHSAPPAAPHSPGSGPGPSGGAKA